MPFIPLLPLLLAGKFSVLIKSQCRPENIHKSNIVWTDRVIFRNMYVHTYMHAIITDGGERGHGIEGEWGGGNWEGLGLGERKGKGEMSKLDSNLKSSKQRVGKRRKIFKLVSYKPSRKNHLMESTIDKNMTHISVEWYQKKKGNFYGVDLSFPEIRKLSSLQIAIAGHKVPPKWLLRLE